MLVGVVLFSLFTEHSAAEFLIVIRDFRNTEAGNVSTQHGNFINTESELIGCHDVKAISSVSKKI